MRVEPRLGGGAPTEPPPQRRRAALPGARPPSLRGHVPPPRSRPSSAVTPLPDSEQTVSPRQRPSLPRPLGHIPLRLPCCRAGTVNASRCLRLFLMAAGGRGGEAGGGRWGALEAPTRGCPDHTMAGPVCPMVAGPGGTIAAPCVSLTPPPLLPRLLAPRPLFPSASQKGRWAFMPLQRGMYSRYTYL